MNDGQQGVSMDRWIMRIRDALTILGIVFGGMFSAYKVIRSIEQMKESIVELRGQTIELRGKLEELQDATESARAMTRKGTKELKALLAERDKEPEPEPERKKPGRFWK